MKFRSSRGWLLGAAGAALAMGWSGAALAQDAGDEPIANAEDIVVLGRIQYRDRSDETAPVLEYGLDYFQRFEPLTAGDALKRVPSAAFLSDVNESDGLRLRGLDPGYTQILINGDEIPGAGADSGSLGNGSDGSFFVDRIPAELIERVEIVRGNSANRSGDAVAGALNIVLRDAYSLNGGYIRAGALYFANDEFWGQTLGGVWGGAVGPGRLLIGANMQDRHNPKDKFSVRYDNLPANGGVIDNTEVQTDVRDGTDYSANFSYDVPAFGGDVRVDGFYVHTDRYEDEDSIEYQDGIQTEPNILTLNDNNVDIEQDSWALNGRYAVEAFGGELRVKLGYAVFTNEEVEFVDEADYLRSSPGPLAQPFPEVDRYTGELAVTDLQDEEFKTKVEFEREFGGVDVEFGIHYEDKQRDNDFRATTDDTRFRTGDTIPDLADDLDSTTALPPGQVRPTIADTVDFSTEIERERLDPYVMLSGGNDAFEWEAGLRYETTDTTVRAVNPAQSTSSSQEVLLPSAHLLWNLTDDDRVRFSVARTIRNPSFRFLDPTVLLEELGDNDFQGDPNLDPELAWGVDVGYERRLGTTGVVGINFFYRDIQDLIEIYNTGLPGSEADIYSVRNTGDGQVFGVEFDLSTPLTFIGLEDTGVFLNYSWLDSEVTDEFGERRFNNQAESIFNVGFIQDLPTLGAAFGVTYRTQGDAFSRVVGEEVSTSYGPNLELFVEKRFGERFSIRFTGSNLLDETKDETFDKFDDAGDQATRNYDEFEVETESAGPVFQLIGRYAF